MVIISSSKEGMCWGDAAVDRGSSASGGQVRRNGTKAGGAGGGGGGASGSSSRSALAQQQQQQKRQDAYVGVMQATTAPGGSAALRERIQQQQQQKSGRTPMWGGDAATTAPGGSACSQGTHSAAAAAEKQQDAYVGVMQPLLLQEAQLLSGHAFSSSSSRKAAGRLCGGDAATTAPGGSAALRARIQQQQQQQQKRQDAYVGVMQPLLLQEAQLLSGHAFRYGLTFELCVQQQQQKSSRMPMWGLMQPLTAPGGSAALRARIQQQQRRQDAYVGVMQPLLLQEAQLLSGHAFREQVKAIPVAAAGGDMMRLLSPITHHPTILHLAYIVNPLRAQIKASPVDTALAEQDGFAEVLLSIFRHDPGPDPYFNEPAASVAWPPQRARRLPGCPCQHISHDPGSRPILQRAGLRAEHGHRSGKAASRQYNEQVRADTLQVALVDSSTAGSCRGKCSTKLAAAKANAAEEGVSEVAADVKEAEEEGGVPEVVVDAKEAEGGVPEVPAEGKEAERGVPEANAKNAKAVATKLPGWDTFKEIIMHDLRAKKDVIKAQVQLKSESRAGCRAGRHVNPLRQP
eukprot:gene32107-16623_t